MIQKRLLGLLGAILFAFVAVGCNKTCKPACSGSTPVCDTGPLTCVECVANTDCSANVTAPVCDNTTNTCVACNSNTDCSGSTPVCDTTVHTCVGCVAGTDCSGSTPVCDTTNQVCVGCLGSGDCSGATPVCNTADNTCVGCLGNGDCSGSTPFCDSSSHTCTATCVSSTDCAAASAATPLCNPATHLCVACLSTTDCSGATPVCNTTSHTCVECASSTDCSGDTSVCDTTNSTCVQCLTTGDCSGGTPSCDTNTHTCKASCSSQTDCTIGQDCNTSGSEGNFCQDVDVAAASTAIGAIRTAAAGGSTTSTQTVAGALVTYLKTSVSGDDPGFFVQAEQAGPALFVAVDPTTVGSGLAIGDRITFTADTLSYSGHLPQVTGISGFNLLSSGHDVSLLRADISSIDPTGDYLKANDSRLIAVTFKVAETPTTANTGYMQAQITTDGYGTASQDYTFYAPATVFADQDLTNGCNATLTNGVLWRYGTSSYEKAEPATWNDSELAISDCPAPTVVSAAALTDATHVDVTFDRNIDSNTVAAGAFTIAETADNTATLTVSDASPVDARTVELTTDAQGQAVDYTVTVDPSVKDDLGTPLGSPNSATFTGYYNPAALRISEVNPTISGANGGDLVELVATTSGTLDGATINAEVNSPASRVKATLPAIAVAANDVILVHITTSNPCSETTSKTQCPHADDATYSDNAWDIVGGGSGFSYTNQVIAVRGADGAIMDAAAFTNGSTASDYFTAAVQMIETGNNWTGTSGTCTDGATCEADSFDWGTNLSSDNTTSAARSDLSVPGSASQWSLTTAGNATFGTYP